MPFGPREERFFEALLQPGDVLLFARSGFFNWVIYHATNAPVSHTEVYIGGRQTAASRNGVGVDIYDWQLDGLAVVLRPREFFDLTKALAYQRSVLKQGYDWTGLWRAFVSNSWGRKSNKQWCSENSTNVQRAGGIEPFTPDIPADMVAPGDFIKSAAYLHVWKAKDIL